MVLVGRFDRISIASCFQRRLLVPSKRWEKSYSVGGMMLYLNTEPPSVPTRYVLSSSRWILSIDVPPTVVSPRLDDSMWPLTGNLSLSC